MWNNLKKNVLALIIGGVRLAIHSISAEADDPPNQEQRRWDLFEEKLTTFQTMKAYLLIPKVTPRPSFVFVWRSSPRGQLTPEVAKPALIDISR